ncbi:long-chain-fatty-acid--CoA ligase FadD15 [Variibacter gotjawalensis]|uniref:Long-chain-fatty-acid--CoA ligase FadD15 n=1 Tax=Variibacter gotjawalensis TaxID=1333996 RepID=A0A0S3PRP4_9BRAD|nr:AMP-binding protein [Variibacter gotjawalensis]NIK48846.1 long-chain acyl-CoA synthetase [Variibacter gotjawalensis]RZS50706.1 long-chain acyl-CoA synthetase [Variibacter gotjawalensis]BAT58540.1 long-chain-fatty-acid--CoA ligase FadD15 [Variibacter gotjawalensis]
MRRTDGAWKFETDSTLIRVLARNAEVFPNRIAMREKAKGIWQQTTWAEMLESVLGCAAGLEELGFAAGDTMLVLGDNSPRLYMGMLAAGALDGYAMPAYPDATLDEIQHFVEEANVRFALAEDQEQVDKILELRAKGASIEHIIYDDVRGLRAYQQPGLIAWDDLETRGRARVSGDAPLRDELINRARPDGPAVFVHSSGSTGKPKGVVLSHRNFLSGVAAAYKAKAFDFGEVVLAYLPMAWVGDFAITLGAGIPLAFEINIPERQETVLTNLRETAPTFYLAAPRSWDNLLTTIQVRMEDSTWAKRSIYNYFMKAAIASEKRKLEGGQATLRERILQPIGEWIVRGPIKDQFGLTRLRGAFTGGEAMGEDTFVFYRALGIKLRQLYGQTETSAYNAMQSVDEVQLHTVGRALPGVEMKINDDGEILVKSGSVFAGYFKNETSSKEALRDGWLHTGDAGYLEPDGHLVVLGRVSEVVHTAKGERYIPNYIENRLKFSPYVKDAAVLGKDRDRLAAIVCIDKDAVGLWAEQRGISYMSYADLAQNDQVNALIADAVRHVNRTLPEGLQLKQFVCLHKEFDADDGEITRTRKIRRNVVEERYKPIIDAIYGRQSQVLMRAQITYETGETGTIERTLAVQEA